MPNGRCPEVNTIAENRRVLANIFSLITYLFDSEGLLILLFDVLIQNTHLFLAGHSDVFIVPTVIEALMNGN